MTTKSKWSYILAAGILLAATLIFQYSQKHIEDTSALAIGNTSESIAPLRRSEHRAAAEADLSESLLKFQRATSEKKESTKIPARELVFDFETAENAGAAMMVIEQAYESGDDILAGDLELKLHARCAFIAGFDAPFERTSWALDRINEFCNSYSATISDEEYLERLPILGKIETSQLLKHYSTLNPEEIEADYSWLMANASFPQDIKSGINVLEILSARGMPIPMGQHDASYASPGQAFNVRRTALQMYSCYRFGGCGPNDYLTQETCVLSGQCERGWSMIDYYANTMSPIDFDLAIDIVNYLYDRQKEG
jgi:hypothetical protein